MRTTATRCDRALFAIMAIGMLTRIAWVVAYARSPAYLMGGDPFLYLAGGRSLVDGHGYVGMVTRQASAFQPPGWPLVLAVAFWVSDSVRLPGSDVMIASVLNVGLGTATIALTYGIARRLANRRIALVAATIVALWPNLVYYTASAALETCFIFLMMLLCWLALRRGWPFGALGRRQVVGIGLVLGLAVLVRPFAVVFPGALAVAAVVAHVDMWRRLREVAAVTAIALCVLVPWTIRNAVELHALVPISTNLGETLCLGHQPHATGGFIADTPYCVDGYRVDRLRVPHDEVLRNTYAMRASLRYIRTHPLQDIGLIPSKLYYTVRGDHDGLILVDSDGVYAMFDGSLGTGFARLGDLWFVAVWLLAVGALVQVWRRRRDPAFVLVAVVAGGLFLIPLGLYGLERFHLPLAPFGAIGAALTLDRLGSCVHLHS